MGTNNLLLILMENIRCTSHLQANVDGDQCTYVLIVSTLRTLYRDGYLSVLTTVRGGIVLSNICPIREFSFGVVLARVLFVRERSVFRKSDFITRNVSST